MDNFKVSKKAKCLSVDIMELAIKINLTKNDCIVIVL